MIEFMDLDSSKEDEDATVQKETSRMLTIQEFWTSSLVDGTAGIFQNSAEKPVADHSPPSDPSPSEF